MHSDRLKSPPLPSEFYSDDILVIKNIRFTPRQIDIIACLISGGTGKTISSLLDIEVKTLEAHKKSIGERIGGGIQEDIIAFVQKSDKYEFIKQHYLTLLHKNEFEKQLKELAKKSPKNPPDLMLEPQHIYSNKPSFLNFLIGHLRLAGMRTKNDEKEIGAPQTYTLSIVTKTTIKQFQKNKSSEQKIFIILDKDINENISHKIAENDFKYIDFRDPKKYFLSCVEILKKVYSDANLEKLMSMVDVVGSYTFKGHECGSGPNRVKNIILPTTLEVFQKKKRWFFGGGFVCLSALCISTITFNSNKGNIISRHESTLKEPIIRSDLPLPVDRVQLRRPKLIAEIGDKLKRQKDIHTVPLIGIVGMGGAGKTILARQFAHPQNFSIVCELNAETRESLLNSFVKLANDLAHTKAKKDELNSIKNVHDSEEREKQIIFFVKCNLKERDEWLLIYDNVEIFPGIKDYLPQDSKVWGSGKVIITTRDTNLKNMSFIIHENIIHIEELNQLETLTLFSKILYDCEPEKLKSKQKQEAKEFLQNIPPFPLYITVAARYIKNTNISFRMYLERIRKYSKDFDKEQENLIKESGDYTKTGYGIIASSIEKLISVNSKFKELLFIMSLLDSQDIPLELLNSYKEDFLVEKFIRNLKKEGLVIKESNLGDINPSFSIHRSIHNINLMFIKNLFRNNEKKVFLDNVMELLKSYYDTHSSTDCQKIIFVIPHLNKFANNLDLIALDEKLRDKYKQKIFYILGYAHQLCSRNLILAKNALCQVKDLNLKYHYLHKNIFAAVLRDLGDTYTNLGELDEAIKVCKHSIELLRGTVGFEEIIAQDLKTIAYSYSLKNNFKEAKTHLYLALETAAKIRELEKRKELKAAIYVILANIYSAKYLRGTGANIAEKYLFDALRLLNADHQLSENKKEPSKKISCNVARIKTTLGHIYCRSGKYKEAMRLGFNESNYIIAHTLDDCSHNLLKGLIAEGIGIVLLREGKVEEAEKNFTESIIISQKLIGSSWHSKVFRAEAWIRLDKLQDAYDDCLSVFNHPDHRMKDLYAQLIYLQAFYHAAIIKYKQNDFGKAIEYFAKFIKEIKIFSKAFFDQKSYENLNTAGLFLDIPYTQASSYNTLKQYHQRCKDILIAIYSPSHPFIRDYVLKM